MKNTLLEMWLKYNLLLSFKNEMNKLGYASKDLYCLHVQLEILMELIEIESEGILNELLKKTYFRLLKKINRGIEYLPDIISNPEDWCLNSIENDAEAWIDNDVLIFTTKAKIAVFSKLSRKSDGNLYVDNKWQ